MAELNKIDFAVMFTVKNANPNGDPLNENRPRICYDDRGEVSDVCLKRKIRNRWQDMEKNIFVQSNDQKIDDANSLKERVERFLPLTKGDMNKFIEATCKEWIDVRSFGQLFALKAVKESGDKGVSIGIRGPVSLHPAFSISPISISSIQITKSVNSETKDKKGSDTMGMKHRVDCGTYVFYGSINPQLAKRTGFNVEDALALKEALKTLFDNDSSSARPDGSMDVRRVYWWIHNTPNGQYSSGKVHKSLQIIEKKEDACNFEDYEISVQELKDLKLDIYEN